MSGRRPSGERERDAIAELRAMINSRDEHIAQQQKVFEDYRRRAEGAYNERTDALQRASDRIQELNASNSDLANLIEGLTRRLDDVEGKSQDTQDGREWDAVFGRFEQSLSSIAAHRPDVVPQRSTRKATPRVTIEFDAFDPEKDSYKTWLKRLDAKLDILDVSRRDRVLWVENYLPPVMKDEFWSMVEIGSSLDQINAHFSSIYGGRTVSQLMRDFENLKQLQGEGTLKFYQRWRSIVQELRSFDIDLAESYLLEYCLARLQYEKEVRKEDPQSVDEAFRLAMRFEDVFGIKSKGTVNAFVQPEIICHYCGIKGHKPPDCRKKARDMKDKKNDRRKSRPKFNGRSHHKQRGPPHRRTRKTINALGQNPRKLPALYLNMETSSCGTYRMEAVVDTAAEVSAVVNTRLLERINHAVKSQDPSNLQITSGDGQAFDVESIVLLKTASGIEFEAYAVRNFAFEALIGIELLQDAEIVIGDYARIPSFDDERFDLHLVKRFFLSARSVNATVRHRKKNGKKHIIKINRSEYGPWKAQKSDYGEWSRTINSALARNALAEEKFNNDQFQDVSTHEDLPFRERPFDEQPLDDPDVLEDEFEDDDAQIVNAMNQNSQRQTLLDGVQADELATLMNDAKISPTDENTHNDVAMLNRFEDRYPELFSDIERGATAAVSPIHLELKDDVERVYVPPRRLAKAEEEIALKEIRTMEELGIIKRSSSSSNCPILVVKQGTKYRVCFDFRKLNRNLRDIDFPIPRVRDLLESLNGASYFTALDLARGFHQLPIHKDSTHLLAFTANHRKYEFVRLPFGLKIAPMAFQQCVSEVLADELWVSCLLYIDDVLVFTSGSINDHERAVDRVLYRLHDAGMKLRRRKCTFGATQIDYLRYTITTHGITPRSSYLQKLKRSNPPQDKAQLRSFLGLIPFLSVFSADINTVTQPLRALLKKNATYEWDATCQRAFEATQAHFDDKLIRHYDFDALHELFVDSSQYATGGYLMQNGHIVLCTSIGFPDAVQISYSATERELLGIVLVIKKLDRFLFGRQFIVYTDHRPLVQIFTKKNFASRRIARLVLRLQEYVFESRYIPGKDHLLADHLSRVKTISTTILTRTEAYKAYQSAHSAKHWGIRKTLKRLNDVYWPGKRKDVREWISSCRCAQHKENRKSRRDYTGSLDLGRHPYHVIALDIYSYNGCHFLTILDMYSDYIWILRCTDKSMETVSARWRDWLSKQGERPREVLTDRGTEFNFFEQYEDIHHRRTASYRPQSNGRLERRHKELSKLCRIRGIMPDELDDLNDADATALLAEEIPEIHKFKLGDSVYRYVNRRARHKHEKVWTGPWKILRILGEHTVQLDSGSVVNVNDLKIRKAGGRIDDFYLHSTVINQAFDFWKVQHLPIEDVFREEKDPWNYDWSDKFILISIREFDFSDVMTKAIHEPCVLIMHLPDLNNDENRVIGTMEADWIELPDVANLFVNREDVMHQDDGIRRWLVWIDQKEFEIVADNWGGNVETWMSSAAQLGHRGKIDEEDIFTSERAPQGNIHLTLRVDRSGDECSSRL